MMERLKDSLGAEQVPGAEAAHQAPVAIRSDQETRCGHLLKSIMVPEQSIRLYTMPTKRSLNPQRKAMGKVLQTMDTGSGR